MASSGPEREQAQSRLREYLQRQGLKHTRQRDVILDTFLSSSGHLTTEQLYVQVHASHPEIGAATVYRTLKLFVDAGIANSGTFLDGVTVYEHFDCHHDHLICLGCGAIAEFECPDIEERQEGIARDHGYRLIRHRHHLYGYCTHCQSQGRDAG